MSDDYRHPQTDLERAMIDLDHTVALALNYWHDGIMTEEEVRRVLGTRGIA